MESKERGPGFYYWICALLGFSLPIIFFLGPDLIEALPAVLIGVAVGVVLGRVREGFLPALLSLVSFLGGIAAAFLLYVGLMFYALSF